LEGLQDINFSPHCKSYTNTKVHWFVRHTQLYLENLFCMSAQHNFYSRCNARALLLVVLDVDLLRQPIVRPVVRIRDSSTMGALSLRISCVFEFLRRCNRRVRWVRSHFRSFFLSLVFVGWRSTV
jgi:hypothetical protein